MDVRIVSEEGTIGCRKVKVQDGLENLRTIIKKLVRIENISVIYIMIRMATESFTTSGLPFYLQFLHHCRSKI